MRCLLTSGPALLLAAGLAVAGPASPPLAPARWLTVADGLSQGFVPRIVQDGDGFVWMSTVRGLDRYDGYTFRHYQHDPDDPGSLGPNEIYDLHIDPRGRLWVATEAGLDRYDGASDSFVHYPHAPETGGVPRPNIPSRVQSDAAGRLWYATAAHLYRQDPTTGELRRFPFERPLGRPPHALVLDSADRLWLGFSALGRFRVMKEGPSTDLFFYERASGIGATLPEPQRPIPVDPRGPEVAAVAEGPRNRLWVAFRGGGLLRWDPASGEVVRYRHRPGDPATLSSDGIYHVAFDPEGALWSFEAGGTRFTQLDRVDPETGIVERCPLPSAVPCTGAEHRLLSLLIERSGAFLFGTDGGGVLVQDTLRPWFTSYRHEHDRSDSLAADFVRAVYRGRDGQVWVGTTGGLTLLDRGAGRARQFTPRPSHQAPEPDPYVRAIHEDRDGTVWVGMADGLYRFDRERGALVHYPHGPGEAAARLDLAVVVIHEGARGRLWLGVGDAGLVALDPRTGALEVHPPDAADPGALPDGRVTALFTDGKERLWVGTRGGLALYEPETATFRRYRHRDSDPESLSGNQVTAVFGRAPEPDVLWVGTEAHGLNRLDVASGRARRFAGRGSDLPSDSIMSISGDGSGRLWVGTGRGLTRFDPGTGESRTYGRDRGLPALEFNQGASHRGPDGELFFGTTGGLVAFFPDRLTDNPHPPRVLVTAMSVLDRSASRAGTPLVHRYRYGMATEGPLELQADERDLAFDYVGLHYSEPEGVRYRYQLEGFETDWHEGGSTRQAVYTNLDPGRYTFRVRAANSDGVWSEGDATLSLTIHPPFTATPWFRGLLGLALVGAALGAFQWRVRGLRRQRERLRRQVAERTEELERTLGVVRQQAAHLEKLDAARSRLFANISHEFRTPLTLTLGPLEDVRSGRRGDVSDEARAEVDLALRNTRRQLALVDQLLALARLDAGGVQLRARALDLAALLRQLAGAFDSLAERQGIALETDIPGRPVEIWADAQKLEQVVTNLLSNAFKFTPTGGTVRARLHAANPLDGGRVTIEVQDTGMGIPPDELDRVFDRFYQADPGASGRPGVGIGLTLVRELVELHRGEVSVESEPGVGSTFTVRLRQGRAHLRPEDLDAAEEEPARHEPRSPVDAAALGLEEPRPSGEAAGDPAPPRETRRRKVLVVEDNAEMRGYLRKHLAPSYDVVEADDGARGLELAERELPDLIVSDVMMPGLDGLEVCRTLKSNPELDFIPLILLTAKADIEAKLEGLGRGADDYIAKPFDARELGVRIRNLIAGRERLKEQARRERLAAALSPEATDAVSADEAFLGRVRASIQGHLEEDGFGVVELARELGMSRQHLHRRLQDLDAPSPSELIIQMRLERAERLLARRAGDVSEVAYGVGFKSVSHFVRRFRERTGVTPAAFAHREDPRVARSG